MPNSAVESFLLHTSKLSFTDLAPEIQLIIFKYAFFKNISLIPIITSCKQLYRRFAYLIYRFNAMTFTSEGYSAPFFAPYSTKNSVLTYSSLNKQKLCQRELAVLNVISRRQSHIIHHREDFCLQMCPLSAKFEALVVLNVECDSPRLLMMLLTSLPRKLQVVSVNFTGRKTSLKRDDEHSSHRQLSEPPEGLKYFSISCSKRFTKSLVIPHAFMDYQQTGPSEENLHRYETSECITKLRNLLLSIREKNPVHNQRLKLVLGSLIYTILKASKDSLLKVEIEGFDLLLVFDPDHSTPPFRMPSLKVLCFDSASMTWWEKWLNKFQLENYHNSKVGKIRFPVLICDDVIGNRVYYKQVDSLHVYQPGGESALRHWYTASRDVKRVLNNALGLYMR